MFELGIKMFFAYLLGSVSGSLVLGRLRGTDIREQGSGNAGATNALRTQGLLFAIGVALIDVGKGILATGWIPLWQWLPTDPVVAREWVIAACGMAAVTGHIFPFWHQFRGGKGAATLIGSYCILAPKILIPTLLIFVICVVASGYVGFSTLCAVLAAVVFTWVFYSAQTTLIVFAIAMAILVAFAHRGNIQRMISGTENRLEKAMFWRS